jgi:flavin-dependent dehydrogenase
MPGRPERFAAVVAGGGPAGAAAALVLARAGRRVLLLDEPPAHAFRIGESLPPAARPLLRDLGLLDGFLADGHLACYGNLSSWGSPALRSTDFLFDPNGHGWHLDRARFDARLRDEARAAGAEVRSGVRVANAEAAGGGWKISWADGSASGEVRCDGVVDASGRRCAVARRHGAIRRHHDALVSFYARFRPVAGTDRDGRTLIESTPEGWWYTALVPSGERVVAYQTDADLADRSALLSADGFAAALDGTEHVRAVLSAHGHALVDRPRGADAGSARLDRFVDGRGWLAAGDAALAFDPLSSQGLLNALYTGMKAGWALHAHCNGDGEALALYAGRLEEIHRAYQHNRTTYYGEEGRWADRPFWRRRAAVATVAD